jgi:hypothetical protein
MHDATHAKLDRHATLARHTGRGPARRGSLRRLGAALLLLVLAHGQAQPASGTRVMHYASSATTRGVQTQLVPNSEGRFEDPRTGQRFSLEELGTSAGHGFTQVDFVHVDAAVCVGVVTSFGMDAFTSAVTTISTSAFVTDGGQCSDFWIHPNVLAQMPESSSSERSVLRGEELFRGQLLQVQRTRGTSQNGTFQHAYSSASGFLLIASSSVGQQVVTLGPNNTRTPATGSTILTYSELRGVRHVANPALGAPLPEHVRGLRTLHYAGATAMTLPGAPVVEQPFEQRLDVVTSGDAWLALRASFRSLNPLVGTTNETQSEAVLTASYIGGYFLSPAWLLAMAPGELLDEDGITGFQTWVRHVDERTVVITRRNASETTDFVYDRANGWLVELVSEQQVGPGTHVLRGRLVGVE